MSVSTVHGRVLSRPGDHEDRIFLGRKSLSTASDLQIFFSTFSTSWRGFFIKVFDLEKPSANNLAPAITVSTNGATFETAAAYNSSKILFGGTATTCQAFTQAAGGDIGMAGNLYTLATATTVSAPAEIDVTVYNTTATSGVRVKFDFCFLSSASSPAQVYGSGAFASGPCAGISISFGGTVSLNADIYGIGQIVT